MVLATTIKVIYRVFTSLLNVLYPPTCIRCKETCFDANLLCEKCWSSLTFITREYCKKCGTSFLSDNHPCLCTEEHCIHENHLYHSTRSVIEYNGTAKDLIKRFKFHAKFEVVRLFKNWFNCVLKEHCYQEIDYIIPVPLHKQKLKIRGYNQTAILAKIISQIIRKKYYTKILLKVKGTADQSGLKGRARKRNLIGAFDINHENAYILKNKRILLVDDIITTGTTVNECSKILLKYGAFETRILSLARR